MSVSGIRYREFYFKTRKELEEFIRKIEEKAVETVKAFSFTYRKKTIRATLYQSQHPWYVGEVRYWLVQRPRREAPRVWLVTIKDFALCDLDDGRRAKHDLLVTWKGKRKLYALCDYHFCRDFFEEDDPRFVKAKIKEVPDPLCRKYCPQFWEGFCKAWMPSYSLEESVKHARSYRGMKFLCLEDEWWCDRAWKKE